MKGLSRRHGFTLIEVALVLVLIGILAALILPVFMSHRSDPKPGPHYGCSTNLQQIFLALRLYSDDHDQRLPRISVNSVNTSVAPFLKPYGWADALQGYARNTELFQCPMEANIQNGIDATRVGFTDYYLNTNASGRPLKQFITPQSTLMCGDGNDGTDITDARYNRNSLPPEWLTTPNSPARRTHDMGNYLFADGHVKALAPEQITTTKPAKGVYTFAIR